MTKNIDMLVDLPSRTSESITTACNDRTFVNELKTACKAFYMARWGNVPQERENANNKALESLKGNIIASYDSSKGEILIKCDLKSIYISFLGE